MTTLTAPQKASITITTPGQSVPVTCATGDKMQVDWVSPGGVTGSRLVMNETVEIGPLADNTVVTFSALAGSPTYSAGKVVTAEYNDLTGMGVFSGIGAAAATQAGNKNTIALLGDSITLRNLPPVSSGNVYYGNDGYFAVANAMLGWPFEISGVFGYSGQQSGYILSTGVPAVQALNPLPKYCFVLAGTNDIVSGGITVAKSIANLKAIYTQLAAAGVTPIVATIPPRNDAGMTQPLKRQICQLNRWIREFSRSANLICCDFYRSVVNPLSAGTSGWALVSDGVGVLNDTSADQIHPTTYGGFVLANEVVRRLQYLVNIQTKGGLPRYADAMYLSGQTAQVEGNIIPNGSFSGAAGTGLGTATGSLADEWSGQGTTLPTGSGGAIVLSKVSKSDSFGYWQQINISGGDAGNNQGSLKIRTDQDYPSAFAALGPATWQVGDTVFGQASFETDAANWGGALADTNCIIAMRVQFFGSSGSVTDAWCFLDGAATSKGRMPSGVLRTPTVQIPIGTTRIYQWLYFRGRGVVRFGDAEVRKVITL